MLTPLLLFFFIILSPPTRPDAALRTCSFAPFWSPLLGTYLTQWAGFWLSFLGFMGCSIISRFVRIVLLLLLSLLLYGSSVGPPLGFHETQASVNA